MKNTRFKISALLIILNEIDHIDAIISNLAFADEIIAVDSFSDDGSFEKLKSSKNVKVYQRHFKNFADQRNFAISKAKGEWVFFMDADERIPDPLRQEVIRVINKHDSLDVYKIKRTFIVGKTQIRFSGLQSDKVIRLFKRGVTQYSNDRFVHELVDYKGEVGLLRHKMNHYSFKNYKTFKQKAEHYGLLKAKELYKKNKRPTWFHFYIKPFYKFFMNYFIRLGILDGYAGYNICYLNSYSVFYRYKKLEELFKTSPK